MDIVSELQASNQKLQDALNEKETNTNLPRFLNDCGSGSDCFTHIVSGSNVCIPICSYQSKVSVYSGCYCSSELSGCSTRLVMLKDYGSNFIIVQTSCVEWKCMGRLSSRSWEINDRSSSGPAMGST